MYVTFIPCGRPATVALFHNGGVDWQCRFRQEQSYFSASCLETAGTAATGVAAGAGTARAGYRDRLPRLISGKGGKSRQLALCRMLAAGTGNPVISLAKRAQQLELQATIGAYILIYWHFHSLTEV